jgi:hypothetical protein
MIGWRDDLTLADKLEMIRLLWEVMLSADLFLP